MNDDLISRDAVIERLKKEDKILYTTTGLNYLIRAIKELPSVTQKSETVTEFADRCRECGAKYGKLLKQVQGGDLISRQAVLDLLFNSYIKTELTSIGVASKEYAELCVDELKELPPVNPQEPKTGHWIKLFLTDMSDIDGQCSECGFIHKFIDGHTAQYNYCPNCGAKMVEPQESEEE